MSEEGKTSIPALRSSVYKNSKQFIIGCVPGLNWHQVIDTWIDGVICVCVKRKGSTAGRITLFLTSQIVVEIVLCCALQCSRPFRVRKKSIVKMKLRYEKKNVYTNFDKFIWTLLQREKNIVVVTYKRNLLIREILYMFD